MRMHNMKTVEKLRSKFKNEGLSWIPTTIKNRSYIWLNRRYFNHYKRILPIQNNLIVLESQGDLSDNAWALYAYMKDNGYLEKYHVIWLVDNLVEARKNHWPNTEFMDKNMEGKPNAQWAKALATCKWFIYDHCCMIAPFVKRPEQQVIYLSHGCGGYKAPKGGDPTSNLTRDDMVTVTGPLAADYTAYFWSEPIEKMKITGYPKLDYFFKDNDEVARKINDRWHFNSYKKVIYWMPTFRQSVAKQISEDYINNQTGLPIFETEDSLKQFSDYLKKHDLLMVFKLHHLQAGLPIFKKHFDNILIVHDEDLHDMGIQLYQFIPFADVMISDYSSITVDYLLLDRPMIFTLDDYEQYEKSRGIYPKNAIDYMKGYHVYNQEELQNSLTEILTGVDKYKNDRQSILRKYHTYVDGNSSLRVLKLVGIEKD